MAERPDAGRRRRSGNPAVRAGAARPRPPAGPARQRLERRSRPWLLRLAALPRWTVLVVVLVAAIAGLLLPGVPGAAVLLVLAALMVWLMVLSWPVLSWPARLARGAVILLVVADAVIKLVRR